LTGEYPFDGSSVGQVILNIGTKDAKPMRLLRPELPAELDAVVLRALARDLNARFDSLEELARALMPFAATSEPGIDASWQGSWGTSSVPLQALGFLSGQGSSLAPASAALPLQAAVPTDSRPARNSLRILAAIVLGAITLPAVLIHFDVLRFASSDALSARQKSALTSPIEASNKSAPATSAAVPKSSRAIEEPPTTESAHNERLDRKVEAASQASATGRSAASARAPTAAEGPKAQPTRNNKPERPAVPPRTSAPPSRILGKRTNGFSLDEF
jgi:hypothetical protein